MAERDWTPNHLNDIARWHQTFAKHAVEHGEARGFTPLQVFWIAVHAEAIALCLEHFREAE